MWQSLSDFIAQSPMEFLLCFDQIASAFVLRAQKAGLPYDVSDALFQFKEIPFPLLLSGRHDVLPVTKAEYFAVRSWLLRVSRLSGRQRASVHFDPYPDSMRPEGWSREQTLQEDIGDVSGRIVGALNRPVFAEIDLSMDALPSRVYAIPERSADMPPYVPKTRALFNFQTTEKLFLQQAHKFAKRTISLARFVPFMAYWPTYSSMSAAQSAWYFHWRGLVRIREYPQTDLSYIFLYVYELINLVGVDSPMDAYTQLKDVWRAYRDTYPRLDRYLYPWACDLKLLHQLDVPKDDLDSFCDPTVNSFDIDRQIGAKLAESPLSLDVSLLSRASNYDITKSKFYRSTMELCDEYISKVMALVDAYLLKQQGGRIAHLFNPGVQKRERYLFQSGLYAGEPRIITVDAEPFSTHPPLRDFLANITRYTENKLRLIRGYKGRLRGIELSDAYMRLIDGYLERELTERPVPQTIIIDADKLKKAASDAEHIQALLHGEDEAQEPKAGAACANGYLTVLDLMAQLDASQRGVIQLFVQNGFEMDNASLRSNLPDLFVQLAIDDINVKALHMLGSLLIVSEQDMSLIDEDYREDLISWARDAKTKALAPVYTGLGDDWNALIGALSKQETSLLQALSKGAQYPALQAIASGAGTMVELMEDHINELAIESIGDILIQNGAITEEYTDTVRLFATEET